MCSSDSGSECLDSTCGTFGQTFRQGHHRKRGLTDDGVTQIRQELGNIDRDAFIYLQDIKNEDLVKFCQNFPDITCIDISSKKGMLTSIAPVAGLKNLKNFVLAAESVADMSPLAGLTKLNKLDVSSKSMGPDLKWMTALTNLKTLTLKGGPALTSLEGFPALTGNPRVTISSASPKDLSPLQNLPGTNLSLSYCTISDLTPLAKMPNLSALDLYGATVKDFSPLANCPKLKKLTYYAVNNADFSTLGTLKQVVELKGGLTRLDNIAFVAHLPALRPFDVFAEYVPDYSPLAASKVEKFQIWQMRVPVGDLGVVGKATSLKELRLWSVDGATNSAGLAGLTNLKTFTITSNYNKKSGEPFDMACAKGWGQLQEMSIANTNVVNAADMAALASLKKLTLSKVNTAGNPFSLAGVGKLDKLQYIQINDSQLVDFEALAGCTELASLDIKGSKGVTSLASIKALPKLKKVVVSRGAFPDAELGGFAAGVKIEQR